MDELMRSVLDSLPEMFRTVYVRELGAKDPDLLERLLSADVPSRKDREAVEDILSRSFMHHLNQDHSPTSTGVEIDNALGAFLLKWPIERE